MKFRNQAASSPAYRKKKRGMLKSALFVSSSGAAVFVLVLMAIVYLPKFAYSPRGKFAVAMAGRSVMDMWFRYWNLPRVCNRISPYRKWPIPYKKYQTEGVFFQYLRLVSPHRNSGRHACVYGKEMLTSLIRQLTDGRYDALLFKFCFVDFADESLATMTEAEDQFSKMATLVRNVRRLTQERRMKLLLCNSLPVLDPGTFGQQARVRFNKWVEEYAEQNDDVTKIDLFGVLSDKDGRLRRDYSVDARELDSHPNMEAFSLLEKELLRKVRQLKR